MSARAKPPVYTIHYLDPFSGRVERIRLNHHNASIYGRYESDLKEAKQSGSSAPLSKWGGRTFVDLRLQQWMFNADVDHVLALEAALTEEECDEYLVVPALGDGG